jgi:hypothetical protein
LYGIIFYKALRLVSFVKEKSRRVPFPPKSIQEEDKLDEMILRLRMFFMNFERSVLKLQELEGFAARAQRSGL